VNQKPKLLGFAIFGLVIFSVTPKFVDAQTACTRDFSTVSDFTNSATITKVKPVGFTGEYILYVIGDTFPDDNKTGVKEVLATNFVKDGTAMDSIAISGLIPDTTYTYKYKTIDSNGHITYGECVYQFHTKPNEPPPPPPPTPTPTPDVEIPGTPIPSTYTKDIVQNAGLFVGKVNRIIFNPLIILLFGAALVYFLYGLVDFLIKKRQGESSETGKSHMMWGLVGMTIMFGVYIIIRILTNTLIDVTPSAIKIDPNPNLQQSQ
jgi:hypothetical protein